VNLQEKVLRFKDWNLDPLGILVRCKLHNLN